MIKALEFPAGGRDNIYTLAQSGTKKTVILRGDGTSIKESKSLFNRAERKQISKVMALHLVEIAKRDGNKKLEKAFRNTIYCMEKVYVSQGKLHCDYCKNRICTVCCCIRKAIIMNKYLPEISMWGEAYFVTLTVKAVSAKKLKALIENMEMGFHRIVETYKKRAQRNKGIKLIGIKSLECNFNPVKRTYNPHFHLVVKSKEIADTIVKEWLGRAKNGWSAPQAQKSSRVKGSANALKEIIKYGSKILTENDLKKKSKEKVSSSVYIKALYNILKALDGKRIFDRFGFNLPKKEKKVIPAKVSVNYEEFKYDIVNADWVNQDTGEKLTDYQPTEKVKYILNNNINKVHD
jgi:hypothetical protein